jgi:hypothetical protein
MLVSSDLFTSIKNFINIDLYQTLFGSITNPGRSSTSFVPIRKKVNHCMVNRLIYHRYLM